MFGVGMNAMQNKQKSNNKECYECHSICGAEGMEFSLNVTYILNEEEERLKGPVASIIIFFCVSVELQIE